MSESVALDDIDRAILGVLRARPRTAIAEVARLANVARGTAQSRIEKLEAAGVVVGYGPEISGPAIGFDVLAFVTVEISQGQDHKVVEHLRQIDEVLEIHAVTGQGDLFCRVVARSNEHLDKILQGILGAPAVRRTETQLVLGTRMRRTEADLVIATFS